MSALLRRQVLRVYGKRALALMFLLGVLAATVMSYLGRVSWAFELFANIRPQLAAASGLAVMAALLLRSRLSLALACALIAVNAAPLLAYLDGARAAPSQVTETFTVLTFNLHGRATHAEKFQRFVENENPDVILLTELSSKSVKILDALAPRYPYALSSGHEGGTDVVLLSRFPPRAWHVDRSVPARAPILVAELCADTGARAEPPCVRVIGLHAWRPLRPHRAAWRNAQLARAAALAAEGPPAVLMGDLNLAPWAPTFSDMLKTGELKDTGKMRGLKATWLSSNPLLGLLIDHILVSADIKILESKVGPALGSDHRPVIACLGLRKAAS
jgi:endonuclease/exonuclease/phosphatase (EEP) superfamily protein YafD